MGGSSDGGGGGREPGAWRLGSGEWVAAANREPQGWRNAGGRVGPPSRGAEGRQVARQRRCRRGRDGCGGSVALDGCGSVKCARSALAAAPQCDARDAPRSAAVGSEPSPPRLPQPLVVRLRAQTQPMRHSSARVPPTYAAAFQVRLRLPPALPASRGMPPASPCRSRCRLTRCAASHDAGSFMRCQRCRRERRRRGCSATSCCPAHADGA